MMNEKRYWVYILTNKSNRVLYTGVTNSINRRVYEHKQGMCEGFAKKYNLRKLVYCEETSDIGAALRREKQIKGWKREKKITLIEEINPMWNDLGG